MMTHGRNLSYDGRKPKDRAETAALAILADLCDRRGVKHALNGCDGETKSEIVDIISQIIRDVVEAE